MLVRERRGGRAFVTPAGREFFSQWVAELIPRVPIMWFYPQGKVEIEGKLYDKFHRVPPPNGPDYLPLTAETYRLEVDAGREQDDATYFALGLVPYNGRSAQHEVEDASRKKVEEWINTKAAVAHIYPHAEQRDLGPYKDLKVVMRQYKGFYAYDTSRTILYDERVSHAKRSGLDVALLFDRPLRAQQPYVPPDLEHIKGVCSEAFHLPKGNCVVEQLWRCLKTRVRAGKKKREWRNLLTKHEVEADMDEAFAELGFQSGEPPFDFDRGKGWRGGGVNVSMVLRVAKKHKFAAWIFHRGRCVHIFRPDGWTPRSHKPVIAMCIYGLHCFFYKDACARMLAHFHTEEQKPRWINAKEILNYGTRAAAPFKGETFDYDRLRELMSEGEPVTLCCQKLSQVEQDLRSQGVAFRPQHNQSPEVPTSLLVPMLNKKCIRIISTPPDWPMLEALCKILQEEGVPIEYAGQSLAAVAFQAAQHFLKYKRSKKPPGFLVAKLRERKGKRCAHCHACFSNVPYEIDHLTPLAEGGEEDFNKPELYQLLCPQCHEAKTLQEAAERDAVGASGMFRGCLSQLGPRLHDLFYKHPKARQVTGRFDGAPSNVAGLVSYDVVKCRSKALEDYMFKYGLPVFCWTDDLEELPHYVDGYDFYLVENELICHDALLIYFEIGKVKPANVRAGVKASAHISVDRYKQACDRLRSCVERTKDIYPEWKDVNGKDLDDPAKLAKYAVLMMIGIMNKTDFTRCTCTVSECSDDHPGRVDRASKVDEEGTLWRFASYTERGSLHGCTRPLGAIALHMEKARMAWLEWRLKLVGVELHSAHVDEIFFKMHTYANPWTRVKPPDQVRYSDGTPVYRFVPYSETRKEVPEGIRHPQPEELPRPEVIVAYQWEVLRNPSAGELKEAVLHHQGCMVEGIAGSGKSTSLKELIVELEREGMKCIKLSYTHDASQEIGGQDGDTILHFLKDHPTTLPNASSTWIIIDEAPTCPLKLFPLLHNFKKFLGARIICCGDWGQNKPLNCIWDKNFEKSETCYSMWDMCGGLRVELTECRRSDQAHFNVYRTFRSLRCWEDYPGGQGAACDFLEKTYPWDNQLPDVAITNSHKDREYMAVLLNHYHRERAQAKGLETYLVKCKEVPQEGTMKPHEQMYVWVGLPTIGSTRNSRQGPVRNGCRYTVTRVTKEEVAVTPEAGQEEIKLTYLQAAQHLRLACARTAASIQGITLRDQRLLLLDARSPYTDHRRLYVSMSRVTRGDYFHVATREQQARLLGK